ncbi:alpha-isopropylmalate synthase regulatory domain-containing protein [Haloarchaeobius sp. HRN-SO-5]|uniref:alpha-isopropylmalate synthase regulatory domain-containing protein n=1 Tax=Haloarchaeobius sp. HRN-SO-5 TaxID=3446118 RepID=UPI003EC04218
MTDLFGGSPEHTLSDADVSFLDTTLRDGEQAPGVSLTPDEKVDIAMALDRAGVSVVEAGSACTGPGERAAIDRVTDLGLDATVTSFARGLQRDVDLALDCDVDGVNLVVPASDRHVEGKVGSTREEVVATTVDLVEYATDHDLWVEVIGEDGSRADLDFLAELAGSALDAGADRVCYADTVGHAGPEHTYQVVERLADLGPTSAHTHDDLGLGVTNALAAVSAGADLVHATVNGVGERAGNVALEEVVIALQHVYDVETLDTTQLYELGQTVARTTGVRPAPNKAVTGANAFAHESGIHTDGTLKDDRMYEPYPPETVGRERRLVLGKHAGRAGTRAALQEHGVSVTDEELSAVVDRVKDLAKRGRRVTDADLLAITETVTGETRDRRVELLEVTATAGSSTPTASVRLSVDPTVLGPEVEPSGVDAFDATDDVDDDRVERVASGTGSGPVDAAVSAVKEALGGTTDAHLTAYHVDAITGGTDAVVTVEVTMARADDEVTVAHSDADITRASVQAMVDALDRLLADDEPRVAAAPE